MDPKHLMQLAVILDKGSITAASKHLMLAQPTLTRNMATLEMQAGTALFRRSRFGVRSTPIGDALAREGRAILRSVQLAREQVSRFQLGLHDQMRIGVGPLIGAGLLPPLLQRLLANSPRLALTVSSLRPTDALDQLLDGDLDLVIAPAPDARPLAGISRQLLAEDRLGIYCAGSHPLTRRRRLAVRDFSDALWLSLGMASPYEREIVEMLTEGGVTRRRTQVVTRGDAMILMRLMQQGTHLAVLPRLPMLLVSQSMPLVELPPPGATVQRNLYLWCKEELLDDPNVIAVRDIGRAILAECLAAHGTP